MDEKLLARVLEEGKAHDVLDALSAKLSLSDLQTLLLAVYDKRVKNRTPAEVLAQYRENRFVRPATAAPDVLLAIDRIAFSSLPEGFEAIELSPVAPLGACSVVAPVSQNNIVTTIRNTEVCSDITNVLALECAERRRELLARNTGSRDRVRLASSGRVLRAQLFSGAASFAHFRLFALCTAGRDEGDRRFEISAIGEQVGFYLRFLDALVREGFRLSSVQVELLSFDESFLAVLRDSVAPALAKSHPGVECTVVDRTGGKTYYEGAGFRLYAVDGEGKRLNLADGG